MSITYFKVTPIIPDNTDKNIVIAITIPVFAPSDTLNIEAINTPRDIPAKFPTAESKITKVILFPKSAFNPSFKNIISKANAVSMKCYFLH